MRIEAELIQYQTERRVGEEKRQREETGKMANQGSGSAHQ